MYIEEIKITFDTDAIDSPFDNISVEYKEVEHEDNASDNCLSTCIALTQNGQTVYVPTHEIESLATIMEEVRDR